MNGIAQKLVFRKQNQASHKTTMAVWLLPTKCKPYLVTNRECVETLDVVLCSAARL